MVAITAGDRYSMVLTDKGTVLSFGYGRHGALCHSDCEFQLEPKPITALSGTRVVAISVGGNCCRLIMLSCECVVTGFTFVDDSDELDEQAPGSPYERLLISTVTMQSTERRTEI